jgi:hypothetical protein
MNALPKKLLPLILFAIAATSLFSVQPAQGFTMTLDQVGSNVVATGSGAFNLTGLTLFGQFLLPQQGQIIASIGFIGRGGSVSDLYRGVTGPTNFGQGGVFLANAASGDAAGIQGLGPPQFWVPQGYVSGAALSNSLTFNNATFASLGVTPGTYVWSWGAGANQNFTLVIGGSVPDGGTTVMLLGTALGALGMARRFLKA